MRWGILINFAVILAVSGVLLFVVFGAALERSAIDAKVLHAKVVADLLESRIASTPTPDSLWEAVRAICKSGSGLRIALYDSHGTILGGCETAKKSDKPDLTAEGRQIKVVGNAWPSDLFY